MSRFARLLLASTATVGLCLATASGASADVVGTTGQGTSHGGFAFVINVAAQPDGSGDGTFEYHPVVGGTDLNIHCRDFKKYVGTLTGSGFPRSDSDSTHCRGTDPTGSRVRYYVDATATDRVPGIGLGASGGPKFDRLCVTVRIFPGRLHRVPVVRDCGPIQSGDIGIVLPG